LEEAAKFVGVELDTIGRCIQDGAEGRNVSKAAIYHGREEWLLKWLLKKLQTTTNLESRYTSLSYCEVSF